MRTIVTHYRKGISPVVAAALLVLGGCSSKPALHTRQEPAAAPLSAPDGKNGAGQPQLPAATQPAAPGAAAGQSARSNTPGKQPPATVKPKPVQLKVYYATDRARSSGTTPNSVFGSQRGTLSLGNCELMFPARDETGSAGQQAPAKLPRPVVRKVVQAAKDEMLGQLTAALAKSPRRRVLVFVPGYNVNFAEAARSTGYLKQALGFEGPAAFFSWPSKGRSDGFAADEGEIEWAQPDLKEFLKELAADAMARNIYLIGQGMGGRALAKAFVYLESEHPELSAAFREVILVAPDLEIETFRRDLAPPLAASNSRITIYASSNDPGLRASSKFQDYPRVGDSGPQLTLFPGLETIDASRVDTSLSATLLAAGNSIIADLRHLIRDGDKPARRPALQAVEVASGRYWRLKRH